jgi:hypothetical protein
MDLTTPHEAGKTQLERKTHKASPQIDTKQDQSVTETRQAPLTLESVAMSGSCVA